MIIICDMDEVIVDMMNPLLNRYNEKYQADIVIDDIVQWELPQDMKDVYMERDFFYELPHIEGSLGGLHQLKQWGHEVIIATNHSDNGYLANQKVAWVKEMMHSFSANMMIGARKDLLQGDVIIDDNPDYLINSPCPIKICMDRPWNQGIEFKELITPNSIYKLQLENFLRVYNWQQILALFEGGF